MSIVWTLNIYICIGMIVVSGGKNHSYNNIMIDVFEEGLVLVISITDMLWEQFQFDHHLYVAYT